MSLLFLVIQDMQNHHVMIGAHYSEKINSSLLIINS
jgi:hypothetical protein